MIFFSYFSFKPFLYWNDWTAWGVLTTCFFSHHCISQRIVRTPLEEQLDTMDPNASLESVPEFQKKPIGTSDFPWGWRSVTPVPSGSAHAVFNNKHVTTYLFLIKTFIKIVDPTMTATPTPIPANTSTIQMKQNILNKSENATLQ